MQQHKMLSAHRRVQQQVLSAISFEHRGISFQCTELGGSMSATWPQYYRAATPCIILFVHSAARAALHQIPSAALHLAQLVADTKTHCQPVMLLLNTFEDEEKLPKHRLSALLGIDATLSASSGESSSTSTLDSQECSNADAAQVQLGPSINAYSGAGMLQLLTALHDAAKKLPQTVSATFDLSE